MDHATRSPTQDDTQRRPLQGGSGETPAAPREAVNSPEDPETPRPAPLAPLASPEVEPLLEGSVKSPVPASASDVSRVFSPGRGTPNGRVPSSGQQRPSLHVQFHAVPAPADSLSSSSSSSDDEDLSVAEARPPDGGWGWVVVFASFMVNLIADGITFSFGIFYVHFLEYFGEGNAKTAWIGGIFMAMPLLSGPIASFLTDRYGCRRVTVLGAVLAAIGFVVSSFVDNMETLFLTFGIMAGFGLSLCYVAAVVIVAYYFEKKRSLATGISVCGSGIGTFLFAPLTHYLLQEYGWRGTTLIMAGFFLNIAVCGMLMRDLPWTTTMIEAKARNRKKSRERKRNKRFGSSVDSFSDSKSSATGSGRGVERGGSAGGEEETVASPTAAQFSSLVDLPTFVRAGADGITDEALELMAQRGRAYAALLHAYPALMLPSRSFSDSGRLHEQLSHITSPVRYGGAEDDTETGGEEDHTVDKIQGLEKAAYARWRHAGPGGGRRGPAAFLRDLRVHRHSLTYRGAMLNISRYRLRASSCPNIYRNSMTTIAKEKGEWYAGLWDFWDLAVDVLDFSHLAQPAFALFCVSNFLLYTWYDVPYVYITDHGTTALKFTESQSSMLISTIGIVNMFGEIFLGWVGDWQGVSASCVYAVCMVVCGGVTALVPVLRSYPALSAASGAFGFTIAANYALTSIILVELITLEKFTNAYGLLLLIQGIANLLGPPLAGWVYEQTGSYDLSFYLAGVFIVVSGFIMFILPVYKRCCRRKRSASPVTTPVIPPATISTTTTTDIHRLENGDALKHDENKIPM